MKQQLAFLVNVGQDVGMGHVYRCIALAAMVAEDYSIRFFTAANDIAVQQLISENGYEHQVISSFDADSVISMFQLNKPTNTAVVLDGYNFDSRFQEMLHLAGIRFLYIDDFANQHYFANTVLNTADGLQKEDFRKESYTRIFTGHDYILLRPVFLRNAGQQTLPETFGKRIFISLGATDPGNNTELVLRLIHQSMPSVAKITVLASSLNPHVAVLRNWRNEITIPVEFAENANAEEIALLIAQSDLAIVSASNIANECIATGVPLACIQTVDNQRHLYRTLTENQLCFPLGTPKTLNEQFIRLLNYSGNADYWNEQIRRQQRWIDGKSPERIRSLINDLYETASETRYS
jgi:UDP-2,4-diacetamido-2,4,6-trideoxy-beta-L-altropyranose hydrolase